jgi:hypothetical protein
MVIYYQGIDGGNKETFSLDLPPMAKFPYCNGNHFVRRMYTI